MQVSGYTGGMPVMERTDPEISSQQNYRKRWTVDELYKLAEIFPGERYELIEGDLICKMGQKPAHAYVIMVLTAVLTAAFPGRVRIQAPIRLPDPDGQYSEPEPDAVVASGSAGDFADRHPGAQDIALLMEVSDSSIHMDREIKYRLYARAGIAEYWIIDIPNRRTIVCREPAGDEYKSVTIRDADEEVTSPNTPGLTIFLKDLLP
jgi:Uma2 family endonuclease